jgi:HK97 gp10 family phage protein
MIKLKVSGVDELNAALKRFGGEYLAEFKMALYDAGEIVRKDALAKIRKRTGAAASTIKMDVGQMRDGTLYAIITAGGGDQYYVTFLEYGTSKMKAFPFMRPALKDNRTEIKRIIRGRIEVVIERAGRTP